MFGMRLFSSGSQRPSFSPAIEFRIVLVATSTWPSRALTRWSGLAPTTHSILQAWAFSKPAATDS